MEQADVIETSAGPLTVQPVEHATLVLSQGSHVLYFDPVGGAQRFAGMPAPTGILVTHEHADHFDTATLAELVGTRRVPVVCSQGVYDRLPEALHAPARPFGYGEAGEIDGVPVRAVEAYNTTPERLRYHPPGLGNGYLLGFGDTHVYVAGDTEPNPGMLGLAGVTVAFLPMNLPYTMVAEQAAEAVRAFRPKIVYPFHYTEGPEPQRFAGLVEGTEGLEVRLRNWYPKT